MDGPRIAILLALYNGEEYLADFLDSLVAQSRNEFVLFVRDDGSEDSSVAIVTRYTDKLRVEFIDSSERVGPAESFRLLLAAAGNNFETYMFADQDDVWLSGKVERAFAHVRDRAEPCLYLTSFDYVDCDGRRLRSAKLPVKIGPFNAVVQSVGPGCSMAINREARELLLSVEIPLGVMHDRWFYFVLSLKGVVICDGTVNLSYRLHGKNAVGAPKNFVSAVKRRVGHYVCGGNGGVYSAFPLAEGALKQLDLSDAAVMKSALELLVNPPRNLLCKFTGFLRLPFERQSEIESFMTKIVLFMRRH